jgi:hypothetical protein
MSDSNVTALFGGNIVTADPPQSVVQFLEELLDQAKAGEVASIAVAFVSGNGAPCQGWEKGPNHANDFVLHSAIACLLALYTDQMNRAGEDILSTPKEPA